MIFPLCAEKVFGHGGEAKDRATSINFENRNVTVEAQMNPADMSIGNFSNAFMKITFFDEDTEKAFRQVTYKLDVFKNGELLARKSFYAENGSIVIDIRPNDSCNDDLLWKCSKYYGTVNPIAGALYTLGQNNPVIEGPIFTRGGLYHINIEVIGAGSIRNNLLVPLVFDLYMSIAQEQHFTFEHHERTVPISVKTYFDDVTDLKYSEPKNKFSFSMPFDWNPDFAEKISYVHHELIIPKSFNHYDGANLVGVVDGVILERSVTLDPFTNDALTVHFIVNPAQVKMINEKLGESHMQKDMMNFELIKDTKIPKWIKNNAGWWCTNSISNDDFVLGMQYLIQSKIIQVNASQIQNPELILPPWVKQNACLWSENEILNQDFIQGIRYLIENNMVHI